MSLGYAQKLSFKEDVGTVGMIEMFDPPEILQKKIDDLAMMVRESKHLVAFTGAGISTSCGIPDFRGPKGVWTLQHEGKGVPEASLPFHCAVPSLTHMALVELEKLGILKFVISQNVDCLHLRSGLPREKLAELHGNSFRELCPSCGAEYVRNFEIETIGLKQTSRRCSRINCKAKLRDTVLDWEDPLPSKEMNAAEKHCKAADVVLCLGTSLQITPACNLPLKCIRGGGKIVIVNLQQTPKDKKASLLIRGLVDKVIAGVMDALIFQIPPYIRVDLVQICLSYSSKKRTYVDWTLRVLSTHGLKAPLPFVQTVEISFPDKPYFKTAFLEKQPFSLKRRTIRAKSFKVALRLNFGDGCGCAFAIMEWPVNFNIKQKGLLHEKAMVFQKLKDASLLQSSCGQTALIEKSVSAMRETNLYACVTNIRIYNTSTTTTNCRTAPADYTSMKNCSSEDNASYKRHEEYAISGDVKEDIKGNLTNGVGVKRNYEIGLNGFQRSLKSSRKM